MKVPDVNTMSVKDFRERGYLQELNRRFLHPLGLAIESVVEADGSEHFGRIWDYREDPEGIYFNPGPDVDKTDQVSVEWTAREPMRQNALGYVIQPASKPS
jgi:hypothetical protein